MKCKKTISLCFGILFIACTCGCKISKNENSLQKTYGADTDYFMGLQCVRQKNTKEALLHFNKAIADGTKYVRRRSFEQKIKLGNIQQQIADAKNYLKIYSDDDALLLACRIFFDNQEFALVINSTDKIDISTCPNELALLRLLSMHKKQDSRLSKTTSDWFTQRSISQEHINFYNEFLKYSIDPTQIELIEPVKADKSQMMKLGKYNSSMFNALLSCIIQFRVFCSNKNFSGAYNFLDIINEYCVEQNIIPLTQYIVADMGKTFYAASKKDVQNANYFFELSESNIAKENAGIRFYSLLYAGRILEKSGTHISKTEEMFTAAIECAPTDSDYDMALWFLLNSKLTESTDACISVLQKYSSTWHNPYYFSDFLDNLSLLLFTGAKWKSFPAVYKIIDGHADNTSTSKFAYLTGQLIKTGFLKGTESEMNSAFRKAFELNGGTDIYYRLLAAKELNLSIEEIEKTILNPAGAVSAENDYEAEILLQGYADFGFEEFIYPEWTYFYALNKNTFSIETISRLSEFVRSCGNATNNNYYKSLHMISKTANLDNAKLNRKVFELSYPKNFADEISRAAKEFGVEEYDMLGLIRTESFFNPIIESNKGALGLTQLMKPTFDDCVQRLKIENPDITDPATNIRIGTYYYSTLVKQLNNSDILALFAYNAGATRVRRWLQTSRIGLGLYKNLPSDLFLETIPISETRNYGRKVIQGAAIYAWLYYDKNPCDIINEMM